MPVIIVSATVAFVCTILGLAFGGSINYGHFSSSPAPLGVMVLFVAAMTTAVATTGALSICAVGAASLLFGLMVRGAVS